MNSLKIFLLSFVLLFALGVVFAQEEAQEEVTQMIALDEEVETEDLELEEPNILPDSPFYIIKNWGRGIRSFFSFNPVARAELREKFANEKLVELRTMIEKKKNTKAIEKATENYQKEIEKIKEAAEKIKQRAEENPQVGKFLDKFIRHQLLHQKILQKLETQVPPEVLEKIKENRERHLQIFGEVMTKLEDKEKIPERLEKNLEEIRGSQFKHFKNLEVLLRLEEKIPEEAKDAIRRAQENTMKRLRGGLEQISPEDQERFKEYLERIGGVKEKHLEILENLKFELKENPAVREMIIRFSEKALEKIEEKIEKMGCPELEKPAPGFCKEGRIVVKKDDRGCIISFDCVLPAEVQSWSTLPPGRQACITLWAPVCGKDGKTYSNKCFTEVAGVKIDYAGPCKTGLPIKERLQRVLPQTTP